MLSSLIQRSLYISTETVLLDSNGLLLDLSYWLSSDDAISLEQVLKLPGGILVAEGGMGKTSFLSQLRDLLKNQGVNLFKLGEYAEDPAGLREDIKAAKNNCGGVFLFDGLDEAEKLYGVIVREARLFPSEFIVWISSRDCPAIRNLQDELKFQTYNLAPLSKEDIIELARIHNINGNAFVQEAEQQGILPLCAKPLGCNLAFSVYKENNFIGITQTDIWEKGIEKLCDENYGGRRGILSPTAYSLKDVISCVSWISLALSLTHKNFIWTENHSSTPTQGLGISDLYFGSFTPDIIQVAIQRGVFRPIGDGRIQFSHNMYQDYLAAKGFIHFIPHHNWKAILVSPDNTFILPQFVGIATWLAVYDEDFRFFLTGLQPELLLRSIDAITSVGADEVCIEILKRAHQLSYKQRKLEYLSRLNHANTPTILRNILLDEMASEESKEIATQIIADCKYDGIAKELSERALNQNLTISQRRSLVLVIAKLNNSMAKLRLKELLVADIKDDNDDQLKGAVLLACWPSRLTTEELVQNLTPPKSDSFHGTYRSFLIYTLPSTFENNLTKDNVIPLLSWAIKYLLPKDTLCPLNKLARKVYSFCWKWTSISNVCKLLAKGYLVALKNYMSPFEKYDYNALSLTEESFQQDTAKRLAVLNAIIASPEEEKYLGRIPFADYPLYNRDDLPFLFEQAKMNSTKEIGNRWVSCINSLLDKQVIESFSEEIDKLHEINPNLIESSTKMLKEIQHPITIRKKRDQEFENKKKTFPRRS